MEIYAFGLRRDTDDKFFIVGTTFDNDFSQEFYDSIREEFVASAITELLSGGFGLGPVFGSCEIGWVGAKEIMYEGKLHRYLDCGTANYQGIGYSWLLREAKEGEFEPSDFVDSNQSL